METGALIEKYQGMLQRRPGDELLQFSLGKALFDAGRFDEAETQFRAAFAQKPDWMVVAMLLARCALHRGDRDSARAIYGQALQMAVDQQHEGPEEEIRAALAQLA